MTTFADLGLPEAMATVLRRRGITDPFPIQQAAIPAILEGGDVSAEAPTGSGKTLAFGLPVLSLVPRAKPHRPTALVLAPTRELAQQIQRELTAPAKSAARSVTSVYGGVGYGPQKTALRRGVDVLVATPGRLEDLMEQGVVDLRSVRAAVIDEADRMADMGFLPAVRRILDRTPSDRQTLLFSATLDGEIAALSRSYQRSPVRCDAGAARTSAPDPTHLFWLVSHAERVDITAQLLTEVPTAIVFTRTRRGADRLTKQLAGRGVEAVAMHGGRSQGQRSRALGSFARGRVTALIATDVAARGIHVDAVSAVVHFDPPADHKDYLHRSGRTGRAGSSGTVVSIVTPEQRRAVRRLQRDLSIDVPIGDVDLSALSDATTALAEPRPADAGRPESREPHPERAHRRSGERARRSAAPAARGSQSIYIANLPWAATADDLSVLFSRYGRVHASTIITDRRGRSKGFGFVDMAPRQANRAIDDLQGATLEGRALTVREAKPRTHGG